VLWHQGESDGSGFDEVTGNPYWVTYQQMYVDMSAAWKQDFPNIRNYYIYQVWGTGPLQELQRELPRLYSHMSIMSTVGVAPVPQIHYTIGGYIRMAQLMSPLVERDNYGYNPTTPITAPDLKRAYFTTTNRTEIALEFGQAMAWNAAAASATLFFLDGVAGKVTSGSASGNVVKLQVPGASTSQTITYLSSWDQNQANLLYGSNGIAALTFYEVPLSMSALPAPTGLSAVPNSNQVVLNWTASAGATGYKVKRALASGGPYPVIGTPSGTTYTDTTGTHGTTYYYVVSATSGTDESADSAEASATINVIGTGVTTTTLARHSGTGSSSTYGAALSFDVTVNGSSTPTGMVTMKDGGSSGTTIGSATLANGACTITTTTLAAGPHANIVAVYAGDSNFAASTSVALSPAQTVNPATPVVTVTGTTSFTYNTSAQGPNTATTGGSTGTVSFSYVGVSGTTYPASSTPPTNAGSYSCTATVAADSNYTGASSSATPFTIAKATPVITWATPAPIIVGTALGTTQLNATSGGVAGNFVYTPAGGVVLAEGSHTLSVQFTPTVTANYNTPAATTVTIEVQPVGLGSIDLSSATAVFLADTAADGNGTLAVAAWPPPNGYYGSWSDLTDGVTSSKWLACGTQGWGPYPGTEGKGAGFYFTLPGAAIMQTIQFFTEDSSPGRSPATMTIEGSNAGDPMVGASWTLLYSGAAGLATTPNNSAGETVSFTNATAYTRYRVLFPTVYSPAGAGGVQLADIVATAGRIISNTYTTWAAAQVPPVTGGADGDSDHDGIPNLVEYALVLDPAAADGSPDSFDGSLLSFTKRGVAVTNGDVTYAIQISTTLAADSWVEVGAYVENNDAKISCTLPTSVGGKVFARLVVTQK
jgi:hypothetical protein